MIRRAGQIVSLPLPLAVGLASLSLLYSGCARQNEPAPAQGGTTSAAAPVTAAPVTADSKSPAGAGSQTSAGEPMEMEIPSISLTPVIAAQKTEDEKGDPLTTDQAELRRILFSSMKPLQIMLGSWHGTTQKEVGDFKGLDKSNWVWDLKSNRKQPAMVMTSDANPYFRTGRLTYFPDRELFQFQVTDTDGTERVLEGTFVQKPETFQGDDRQSHIKYKVELTQTDAAAQKDAWQLVFNQQDNHRFLIEVAKKRGSRFLRVDTIATQREGTSFAKSDEGYGQRECIISGGLGTMPVTFKGTTYWVCCSGCKSAFEEEPEKWIAEALAKKAKGMTAQ